MQSLNDWTQLETNDNSSLQFATFCIVNTTFTVEILYFKVSQYTTVIASGQRLVDIYAAEYALRLRFLDCWRTGFFFASFHTFLFVGVSKKRTSARKRLGGQKRPAFHGKFTRVVRQSAGWWLHRGSWLVESQRGARATRLTARRYHADGADIHCLDKQPKWQQYMHPYRKCFACVLSCDLVHSGYEFGYTTFDLLNSVGSENIQ
jgi:hypothetical protein